MLKREKRGCTGMGKLRGAGRTWLKAQIRREEHVGEKLSHKRKGTPSGETSKDEYLVTNRGTGFAI